MEFVADLHLHSKYSRAVSKDMILPIMAQWAKKKGINILSTGDWTHPLWFREIKSQLEEKSEGLFRLKSEIRISTLPAGRQESETNSNIKNSNVRKEPLFLLSVEVSSIYSQGGKLRRIHNLIFSPSFETSEKINKELLRRGCNLMSDGRPIFGISSENLIELVLTIDRTAMVIPCHAWTPWFSLYGSNSGFDSIEECFGKYAEYIYGVETGLSSDPEMNWRIGDLDTRSILSFSDAHSPAKMGREATVFELEEPTYENIRKAIMGRSAKVEDRKLKVENLSSTLNHLSSNRIKYTIEFYPEEGKYHYNGHRNCKVVQTPQETREKGTLCPVCKRQLTVGVMHRVEQLAQKNTELRVQSSELDEFGVRWSHHQSNKQPPFVKLVPLLEIVAEAMESTVASGKVKQMYFDLCTQFGSEFAVLLKTPLNDIRTFSSPRIAEATGKVRSGNIAIAPGFDGEFGKVKIWSDDSKEEKSTQKSESQKEQMGLF